MRLFTAETKVKSFWAAQDMQFFMEWGKEVGIKTEVVFIALCQNSPF